MKRIQKVREFGLLSLSLQERAGEVGLARIFCWYDHVSPICSLCSSSYRFAGKAIQVSQWSYQVIFLGHTRVSRKISCSGLVQTPIFKRIRRRLAQPLHLLVAPKRLHESLQRKKTTPVMRCPETQIPPMSTWPSNKQHLLPGSRFFHMCKALLKTLTLCQSGVY